MSRLERKDGSYLASIRGLFSPGIGSYSTAPGGARDSYPRGPGKSFCEPRSPHARPLPLTLVELEDKVDAAAVKIAKLGLDAGLLLSRGTQ